MSTVINRIFVTDKIIERLNIPSKYINVDIDKQILQYIKNKIGGKCIQNGYIHKDTIEILGRTNGKMDITHFTGNIIFDIECKVHVFNPPEGMILYCKVINSNKMGLVAELNDLQPSPVRILLAREHHQDNDDFSDIAINDRIFVEVIATRYEYNDQQVQAIGVLSSETAMKKQNPDFVSKKMTIREKATEPIYEDITPENVCVAQPYPEFQPKTPEYQPKTPEFKPQTPEYQPKTPEFKPQTPEYQPKTPEYQPQTPEYQPQTPEYQPKTPEYQPKSPELAATVVESPEIEKTPKSKKKRGRKKKLVIIDEE